MANKPVLFIVDDDVQVLNSVERDLRAHYHGDYRIVKAASGAEALEAVQQLKRRGTPLALFLVDQRMPLMTGTEFLDQAIPLYPEARKVLLTAYADTQAAITSINTLGLDYYLMKPWDPPEEKLFPVLDDLLDDWKASARLPYEGIRVAGTLWSAASHNVKDFLARNQIPYQWLDIEQDPQARAMVEGLPSGMARLPVVFFPDGATLVGPDLHALAEKAGLHTTATRPFYDLVIIGGGPAGLAAAVYGSSEGLRTVMIEKDATGGQAGTSSRIENYLGFPNGVSGADLARRATAQALRFGVEILNTEEVAGLRAQDNLRCVKLSTGSEINGHALLLATGVSVRRLEAPGVEALTGAGIYYGAALTEAAFYRGKEIVVVGGANSAGQAAVYFSRFARQVSMLVRDVSIENGMSRYLVDQIKATANIRVMTNAEVREARGQERLEEVAVADRSTQQVQILPAAAMFVFIGAAPRTDMVNGLLERDPAGYILTGPDLPHDGDRPRGWTLERDPYLLETSCPGIFAAGDVRHGSVKRVATAVGEGAMAIALVHQYLKTV
jgi:thioredoxin reductase (NADPH)